MANAVAKKNTTDVAAFDYGEDVGSGFENQTSADYSIPFIGVLQAMSPQVKDPDEGGIDGARQGMLFNTVTEELYPKDGVRFVPAHTEHCFVEWVPRDQGGGFVAVHAIDSDVVRAAKAAASDFGRYQTPGGNDLVETFYVYGVMVDENDDPGEMAVLAFTSTKIKVYKRFNTKVGMFQIRTGDGRKVRPPLFAHEIRLSSTKEKNNKGDFYNFKIEPSNGSLQESLLPPGDPRLEAGKACKEMVEGGMARAAYDSQEASGGSAAEGGAEEAPF